jgi:RHS repeat-associated protein
MGRAHGIWGIKTGATRTSLTSEHVQIEEFPCFILLNYRVWVYLNPNIGRFWTIDTFEGDQEDPISLNKYVYCHADPGNRTDASGQWDVNCVVELDIELWGFKAVTTIDLRRRVIVYVRADNDHAWIEVDNIDTGVRHTYGRWVKGYPHGAPVQAQTSGVNIDVELRRGFAASRGVRLKSFTPTINAGYNAYNNNCATYAQSEWRRASDENLEKSTVIGSFTFDHPMVLKDSILSKNGGLKEAMK